MIVTLPQILFHSENVMLGMGSKIYHDGKQWVAISASKKDSNLANLTYNKNQRIIEPAISGILASKNSSIEIHARPGTHIFD
jgi:hypothetical protein